MEGFLCCHGCHMGSDSCSLHYSLELFCPSTSQIRGFCGMLARLWLSCGWTCNLQLCSVNIASINVHDDGFRGPVQAAVLQYAGCS